MRETLFNWLQHVISGANCLDLFAGTGALGFEALSRGANSATMIDIDPGLVESISVQASNLKAKNCQVYQADSLTWLANCTASYDIVFLDPPFSKGILDNTIKRLQTGNLLNPGALVYVEAESELTIKSERLKDFKHSRSGQVQYGLLKYDMGEDY